MATTNLNTVAKYIKLNKLGDVYLDDCRDFEKQLQMFMAVPDVERQTFFMRPWAKEVPLQFRWVLLGTFAAMLQSERMSPKSKDATHVFGSNSANGKFIIYESVKSDPVFMKIVLDPTADALECDTVVLRTINNAIGKHPEAAFLAKHFSRALMSSRLLVTHGGPSGPFTLDMNHLFGPTADQDGYYGAHHGLPRICVPAFATNAATPGISLGGILEALRHAFTYPLRRLKGPVQPKDLRKINANEKRMLAVLRNGLTKTLYGLQTLQEYSAFVQDPSNQQLISACIKARILDKIAALTTSLVMVGNATFLAHGDLHTDNILYDMYDDCFVVIDFGRSFVHLQDDALLRDEHAKLMSHVRGHMATISTDTFYKAFGSPYMRDPRDIHTSVRMLQYNVMNDVAGMAFSVWQSLIGLENTQFMELLQFEFLDVHYDRNDDKYILVSPDLMAYVTEMGTISMSDMRFALYPGMLWFALYLHALIANNVVDSTPYSADPQSSVYMALDYDQVIGEDAPIFFAGQFMPDQYYHVADVLEESTKNLGFFTSLQDWMKKVKMSGVMRGGYSMVKTRLTDHVTQKHPVGVKKQPSTVTDTALLKRGKSPFKPLSPEPFEADEITGIYEEHRSSKQSIVNAPHRSPKKTKKKANLPVTMGSLSKRPVHAFSD